MAFQSMNGRYITMNGLTMVILTVTIATVPKEIVVPQWVVTRVLRLAAGSLVL